MGSASGDDVLLPGTDITGRPLALSAAAAGDEAAALVHTNGRHARLNGRDISRVTDVPMHVGDVLRMGSWELQLAPEQGANEPLEPVERRFLETIARAPDDDNSRRVYADWLDDRGRPQEAEFVRIEIELSSVGVSHTRWGRLRDGLDAIGPLLHPAWRRAVTRTSIENCGVKFAFVCPKTWDALPLGGRADVRHCAACDKPVYFVTHASQAKERALRRECIAVDPAMLGGSKAGWRQSVPEPRIAMGKVVMTAERDGRAEVRVIIKADAMGSREALMSTCERLWNEGVELTVIRAGVGDITEGDITLAIAARALFVVGFNVRVTPNARALAEDHTVALLLVTVIDDFIAAMAHAAAARE